MCLKLQGLCPSCPALTEDSCLPCKIQLENSSPALSQKSVLCYKLVPSLLELPADICITVLFTCLEIPGYMFAFDSKLYALLFYLFKIHNISLLFQILNNIPFIFAANLRCRHYCSTNFADDKTKAQRLYDFPQPQTSKMDELIFILWKAGFRVLITVLGCCPVRLVLFYLF